MHVPRSRDEHPDNTGDNECPERSPAVSGAGDRCGEQCETDDAELPDAGRADELPGSQNYPEHERRPEPVPAHRDHARRQHGRQQGEKGDERLWMEHRSCLQHDRQRDEETQRGTAQPGPAGKDDRTEDGEQDRGAHGQQSVQQLAKVRRLVDADRLAELDHAAAEQEEARRGVVVVR